MRKLQLQEKYPVFSMEVEKSDTGFKNTDEIVAHLKEKVEAHKTARFITVFDQHAHMKLLEQGEIAPEISDCKNLLFCLSSALPNPNIAAVRPRSIAISMVLDRFVIAYLEAPVPDINATMEEWVVSVKNL